MCGKTSSENKKLPFGNCKLCKITLCKKCYSRPSSSSSTKTVTAIDVPEKAPATVQPGVAPEVSKAPTPAHVASPRPPTPSYVLNPRPPRPQSYVINPRPPRVA